MAKKSEPLVSLDLGANGGKVKFQTIEEIEAWVNHEIQVWQWLQKCTTYDGHTNTIWSQQSAPWNKLVSTIARLKAAPDSEKPTHLSSIKNILTESYIAHKTLHSSTPRAKYLFKYSSDPNNQQTILVAAYALGYFIKAPFKFNPNRPENTAQILIGLQEAILFDKGLEGRADAEKAALEELRQLYQTLTATFSDQITDGQKKLQETIYQFESGRAVEEEKFQELFSKSKATLDDITNTYDQKLALQASVSYWKKKADKHRDLAIIFGVSFTVALVLAGYWFYLFINPYVSKIPTGEAPPTWTIALMIIFAVVAIWIIRIIVRVLLSQIHLQLDASERTTMLLTYLALLREGKSLADNDKKLILEALFRPSTSGIVKDDGIPASIYDYITRSGGKG